MHNGRQLISTTSISGVARLSGTRMRLQGAGREKKRKVAFWMAFGGFLMTSRLGDFRHGVSASRCAR
jgi:hypothetical protein